MQETLLVAQRLVLVPIIDDMMLGIKPAYLRLRLRGTLTSLQYYNVDPSNSFTTLIEYRLDFYYPPLNKSMRFDGNIDAWLHE